MLKNGKSKPLIEFSTKREYFIKVILPNPLKWSSFFMR